jgi:hypothetical protein
MNVAGHRWDPCFYFQLTRQIVSLLNQDRWCRFFHSFCGNGHHLRGG